MHNCIQITNIHILCESTVYFFIWADMCDLNPVQPWTLVVVETCTTLLLLFKPSKNESVHTHTHTPNITHKDTHLWGTESVYLIHTSLHGMTLAAMSVLDQYYQAKFGSGLQFSHLPPNNKKEILSLRHRDQTCHSRVYYSLKLTIAHNGSTCSLKVQHITPTGHLIYLTSATKEHSVSDRAKP